MKVFGDYAYYYNAFYGDKDYAKEASDIHLLINRYSEIDVKTLLNMGCGTGRHDVELAKQFGYEITGIDLSESMIAVAKANLLEANIAHQPEFSVSDIRTYEPAKKFDAVLSLFHVMSYQNTNEDFEATVNTAYKGLDVGGMFIFDVWYGPGVLTDRPAVRVKKVEDDKNILIRNATPVMHPVENIVDVNYDILVIDKKTSLASSIKECHNMRYFFTTELKYMLEKNGFEMIDCIDCATLDKPTYDSWTAYIIAKKVN